MEDLRRWQREDRRTRTPEEKQRPNAKKPPPHGKRATSARCGRRLRSWADSPRQAIGWGPFAKWLETPKDDEAAKQSKQDGQKLAAQSSRTVDALISEQSTALPSGRPIDCLGETTINAALTAATEPHTAPSQPVAPQAAEKNQPIEATQAAEVAQQAEAKDDGSAYIRSLSAETTRNYVLLHCIQTLMFHLFALAKNQHPEWNSVTVPNLCAEFFNKEDMSR